MVKNDHKMGRNVLLVIVSTFLLFLGGCGLTNAPVNGGIYNGSKGPISATSGVTTAHSKVGKATCRAFTFYLSFAWGDCSIQKAQQTGGLSEVMIVDNEIFEILGIYGTYTTVVYGN